MKLSIIIPVFNEEKTISKVVRKVIDMKLEGIVKEVIVVNDGSTDRTSKSLASFKGITIIKHEKNQGKGSAVRTGIKKATGDYMLIQDADLEYDPKNIRELIAPVLSGKAKVVYGTRLKRLPNFVRDERSFRFFIHYIGNKTLSFLTSILYGQWITDMETCYKLFPKSALLNMQLFAKGFEFEPEITAKLLKRGFRIAEVSIRTTPRSYSEGKKLHTVRDGMRALWTLLKYRFID